MKAFIQLLPLLLLLGGCKGTIQANNWLLGDTPEQVRKEMLSKPGRALSADKGENDARIMQFTEASSGYVYSFAFKDNKLVFRFISMPGIHKEDIDKQYKSYDKIDENSWVDTARSGEIYINREYDGGRTVLRIGTKVSE